MLGEDTVMELRERSEINSHFWKLSLHFVYNNQHAIQCKPIISNIHGRWLSLKASTCQKINIENTLFAFQGTVSYFENRVSITHCFEGLLDMTSAQ